MITSQYKNIVFLKSMFLGVFNAAFSILVAISAVYAYINFEFYFAEVYSKLYVIYGCPINSLSYSECMFGSLIERGWFAISLKVFTCAIIIGVLSFVVLLSRMPFRQVIGGGVTVPVLLKLVSSTFLYYCVWAVIVKVFDLSDPNYIPFSWADLKKANVLFEFWVVAPLIEEIIFRGFLQSYIQRTLLGAWGAIILGSVLFGLLHGYGLYGTISLFLVGIFFGVVKYKTNSLGAAVLVHSQLNILVVLSQAIEI